MEMISLETYGIPKSSAFHKIPSEDWQKVKTRVLQKCRKPERSYRFDFYVAYFLTVRGAEQRLHEALKQKGVHIDLDRSKWDEKTKRDVAGYLRSKGLDNVADLSIQFGFSRPECNKIFKHVGIISKGQKPGNWPMGKSSLINFDEDTGPAFEAKPAAPGPVAESRPQVSEPPVKELPYVDAWTDIEEHTSELSELTATERRTIVSSRIGQGRFRERLIEIWMGCAVTGLNNAALLRASHAKPWRLSSNAERLNPYNGLLLIPSLDFLFDLGLITFERDGQIRISAWLSKDERAMFGLNDRLRLRMVHPENQQFLQLHRENVFERYRLSSR